MLHNNTFERKSENEKVQNEVMRGVWRRIHSALQPIQVLPRMFCGCQKASDRRQGSALERVHTRK